MAEQGDDGVGAAEPKPGVESSRVFIPCPVCRAPIELPSGVKELPKALDCPHCGARLER